jgi:hypothetical protein
MSLVVLGFFLVPLLMPRKPESVTLQVDALIHDTCSPPLPWPLMFLFGPMALQMSTSLTESQPLLRRRRRRVLPRAVTGPITLARVGERQRLTIDHGADRVEIGACLREPEREWLADVLQQWWEEGDHR